MSLGGSGWILNHSHWDEKLTIQRHWSDLGYRAFDLSVLDRQLARLAPNDKRVERLMTISGIHVTVCGAHGWLFIALRKKVRSTDDAEAEE